MLPSARPSGRDGRQDPDKTVCRNSLDRLNASMIEKKRKKKSPQKSVDVIEVSGRDAPPANTNSKTVVSRFRFLCPLFHPRIMSVQTGRLEYCTTGCFALALSHSTHHHH